MSWNSGKLKLCCSGAGCALKRPQLVCYRNFGFDCECSHDVDSCPHALNRFFLCVRDNFSTGTFRRYKIN